MSLKFLAALLLAAKLLLMAEAICAEEFALSFETFPRGSGLKPQADPALLTLIVTGAGAQAAAGWVTVRLEAPPPGRIFSTDFPVVEGSRLLELRLPVIDGKAEWRQVFPIRGEYRLKAEFVTAAGAKTGKTFGFQVHENAHKWLALGVFALGLFITGVIAGRVFATPQHYETAKLGLWLFLLFAFYAAAGKTAWAGEERKRNYISKLEIGSATVGAPARIHWRLHPAGVEGKASAQLSLTITHLEHNREVFSVEKIPVAGEFAMDYHFTDGSDYLVTAIGETNDGETVRQEHTVSVTAMAPPLSAKAPVVFLFLAVITAGLAVGRWSRRAPSARFKVSRSRFKVGRRGR